MTLRSILRALMTLGRGVVRGLPAPTADRDPIALFQEWLTAAERAGLFLPEAMAVATSTSDGVPSVRMILLKQVDHDGFVFFTNYESRKAQELDANPRAALLFHWPILQRQVRVEGTVTRLDTAASEAYFRTRPRGSRIGAWASRQSGVLQRRSDLHERVRRYEKQFEGQDVPLPPFWGGYRVVPERIEFWQGRAHRLHDRLAFTRQGDQWEVTRLYP